MEQKEKIPVEKFAEQDEGGDEHVCGKTDEKHDETPCF